MEDDVDAVDLGPILQEVTEVITAVQAAFLSAASAAESAAKAGKPDGPTGAEHRSRPEAAWTGLDADTRERIMQMSKTKVCCFMSDGNRFPILCRLPLIHEWAGLSSFQAVRIAEIFRRFQESIDRVPLASATTAELDALITERRALIGCVNYVTATRERRM